jgi:peptide/nickel transport system permease protein
MDHAENHDLDRALELLNTGRCEEAAVALARVLAGDAGNERAWHMLSYCLSEPERQIYALERVLRINPGNRAARSRFRRLTAETLGPPKEEVAPAASALAGAKLPKAESPESDAEPKPSQTNRRPGVSSDLWKASPAALAGGSGVASLALPAAGVAPALRHRRAKRLWIRSGLAWRRFKMDWAVFSQSRLAILGLVLIAVFGLMAIAHPILLKTVWPRPVYDPVTGFDMMIFEHPTPPAWVEAGSTAHLLGTDTLGRDVLSMLLAATTPTFVLGLTAAFTTAIVGTAMAVIAAYFRGTVDTVITNLADVFLLLPAPVIMVIIGARFRDLGPVALGLIYGFVTGAGPTALVLRTHALQVVSKPFMEAAHIAGGGAVHVITKHLLPAMMPLAALQMMIAVTGAVVADGFISFFGLTRTVSNWGTLIYDSFVYGQINTTGTGIWHMLLPAALCFSFFAMGFYLVSRGLHRVASPTIREDQIRV